ncbi:MAG: phage holin family protein [Ignavibacterium sp.]|nr:phage holin family protein [Ignavibacterium sp.]
MREIVTFFSTIFIFLFGSPNAVMYVCISMFFFNLLYGLMTEENKTAFVKMRFKMLFGYAGLIFVGHQFDKINLVGSLGYEFSFAFILYVFVMSKEIRMIFDYIEKLGISIPSFLKTTVEQIEEKYQIKDNERNRGENE